MPIMDELSDVLNLEPIEVNLFRGVSPPHDRQRIFGGQVVAQALMAAYRTVEGPICHSLQSYFIRPGDPSQPVLYQVERSRDGKSFMTRRVIAIQKGEQIFNMACSFQTPEDGYDHQTALPEGIARPDTLPDDVDRIHQELKDLPESQKRWVRKRPIEMRAVDANSLLSPVVKEPLQYVWLRARGDLGDDVSLNQGVLAYASDFSLLGTSLRPHGASFFSPLQSASLDHIVWFHRPTNFSRWHVYVQDSPSASGARGFNRGAIYREDGVLVASTAQEGLMRKR
jgi:acyl-CoA thioesterase II